VLGEIATAYGFLEGKGNHPSLKLGGAFLVADLAASGSVWVGFNDGDRRNEGRVRR